MLNEHILILEKSYNEAEKLLKGNNNIPTIPSELPERIIAHLNLITDNVEYFLGVNNVLITSFVEKIAHPDQDIRLHQAKMKGGYSGRTLDTQFVAPFLKSKQLRSMVESGWLTRSLEQGFPYDLDYRGAIRNKYVKQAFLETIDYIQNENINADKCLVFYLQKLILLRERENVIIKPLQNSDDFSINNICHLLDEHFSQCSSAGTAKLPVIAIYSLYECLIGELKRFEGKTLAPLGHHTSADYRSKAIGDVQVNDESGQPFEGVEVKYKKPITFELVETAYRKIKNYPVKRYYILSTEDIADNETPQIQSSIRKIADEHGCQVITNGLTDSIKYYLRLIEKTEEFIEKYTSNLLLDSELKIEHKEIWKKLING